MCFTYNQFTPELFFQSVNNFSTSNLVEFRILVENLYPVGARGGGMVIFRFAVYFFRQRIENRRKHQKQAGTQPWFLLKRLTNNFFFCV